MLPGEADAPLWESASSADRNRRLFCYLRPLSPYMKTPILPLIALLVVPGGCETAHSNRDGAAEVVSQGPVDAPAGDDRNASRPIDPEIPPDRTNSVDLQSGDILVVRDGSSDGARDGADVLVVRDGSSDGARDGVGQETANDAAVAAPVACAVFSRPPAVMPGSGIPAQICGVGDASGAVGLSVTRDLDRAAVGTSNGYVRLFDPRDGSLLRSFRVGPSLNGVTMAPNGRWLASTSGRQIKLWQLPEAELVRTWAGPALPTLKEFSADGRIFAAGFNACDPSGVCPTTGFTVWNVSDGSQIRSVSVERRLAALAFSPDASLVGTVSYTAIQTVVQLWRLSDGMEIRTLEPSTGSFSVVFSPDGKLVASSGPGQLKIWNVSDGTLALPAIQLDNGGGGSIAFSADGESVINTTQDNAYVIRTRDGAVVRTIKGMAGRTPVFSPDGASVAGLALVPPNLQTFRFSDGTLQGSWRDGTLPAAPEQQDWPARLQFFPGDVLALQGRASTRQLCLANLAFGQSHPHSNALAFSPDGTLYASTSPDGSTEIRRSDDNAPVQVIPALLGSAMEFSADGGLLALGDGKKLSVWDVRERRLRRELVDAFGLSLPAFSPDGDKLAAYNGFQGADAFPIRVFSVADGSSQKLKGHGLAPGQLAFGGDGSMLVVASVGRVSIWQVTDGTMLRVLPGGSMPVAVSARYIATRGTDDIKVWNFSEALPLRTLTFESEADPLDSSRQRNLVANLRFSGDGSVLASSHADGSVKVWCP